MLPYTTIQEAEAALGRHLTTPESLWFSYSSDKSDYFIYCHTLLFLFVIFSLGPLYYNFLELIAGESLKSYKVQPNVKFSFSEVFSCYLSNMGTFFFVVAPLQIVSCPTIKMIGTRTSLALPSVWEIIGQVLVCFLVDDYGSYWIHRWLHCRWAYEKFHKVHHEYTAPFAFAAPHVHWVEIVIVSLPSFLGPAMVPGHIITFWIWVGLRQFVGMENHSGYNLPWTLTKYIPFYGGAEHHDYHHYVGEKCQSKFSTVFTYNDYIYGTSKGYLYKKRVLQQLQQESKRNGEGNGVQYKYSSGNKKVE